MSNKILIVLGGVIVIIILGGLAMFSISHFSAKSATQRAAVTCIQGDREADKSAAIAQQRADARALAESQALLRDAQKQAELARMSANAATARAASLTASLAALKRSDAATKSWADQKIPQALRDSTQP